MTIETKSSVVLNTLAPPNAAKLATLLLALPVAPPTKKLSLLLVLVKVAEI
jgi:hypothetical protein